MNKICCYTCEIAVERNHLDCLKEEIENKCKINKKASYIASMYGSIECLKYLRENKCRWDKDTCRGVASGRAGRAEHD